MLSILQSSNDVVLEDGRAMLRERAYIPMVTPIDKINILGRDVGDLVKIKDEEIADGIANEVEFEDRDALEGEREFACFGGDDDSDYA